MNRLLREALAPVKEFIATTPLQTRYAVEEDKDLVRTQLRFDWANEENYSEQEIFDNLFFYVEEDLEYLLDNGDVDNYSDFIARHFDGTNKRKLPLKAVQIPHAVMFREFNPKREQFEYTLFLVLRAGWDETTPYLW